MGAGVVSGFADAHKSAIAAGFPDTIDTYGLISGLWTSGERLRKNTRQF